MKKASVCVLAMIGGLLVIGATMCMILGIINFATYGNWLWLLLLAAPAVLWMPIKMIYALCDKINGTEEKDKP